MRTLFPHETVLRAKVTEEARSLTEMFGEQDTRDIRRRLDAGERHVVVVIEFTVAWGGFSAKTRMPGLTIPDGQPDKHNFVHWMITDVLLRPVYKELCETIREHGWTEKEVKFCEFAPKDADCILIEWC